jgi:tagatose-1,6-bisphosphate aldolase non-catalytic subunit AgaZ/GatZ
MTMSPLQTLLASHRAGANVGLYSVCCSNEQVLRAATMASGNGTGSSAQDMLQSRWILWKPAAT